jgi:acyl-[acyl-carrier-protein] desaturase
LTPHAKIEEIFFKNYLEFFHNAEERRRWNIQKSIPWDQVNPEASDTLASIVETFSAVELYLPDYTSKILHLVRRSRGRAWFQANWGYEESKHSLVLAEWLERSGKRTEKQLREFEGMVLEEEWKLPFDHPRQMIIYTMIQELATWLNYRNLRKLAVEQGDMALAKLLQFVSGDERCHYDFFRKGVKTYLEYQPRETFDDIRFVFQNFYMPAKYELRDYDERAEVISQAGIYGPRDYIKYVRDPILADLGLTKKDLKIATPPHLEPSVLPPDSLQIAGKSG